MAVLDDLRDCSVKQAQDSGSRPIFLRIELGTLAANSRIRALG